MDKAERIVKAIEDDFTDRRGLRQEWEHNAEHEPRAIASRASCSCSALQSRIAELEEGLRQIAIWSQEDQDNPTTCAMQWRGCVAIARGLLKPNEKIKSE